MTFRVIHLKGSEVHLGQQLQLWSAQVSPSPFVLFSPEILQGPSTLGALGRLGNISSWRHLRQDTEMAAENGVTLHLCALPHAGAA